jgi:maleate cis-trans isomerase
VVTSNQAALWGTLRAIGDRRTLPGGGRLFGEA